MYILMPTGKAYRLASVEISLGPLKLHDLKVCHDRWSAGGNSDDNGGSGGIVFVELVDLAFAQNTNAVARAR